MAQRSTERTLVEPHRTFAIDVFVAFAAAQDRLSERDLTDPRIDPEGTPGWATVNLRAGWQATDHLRLRLAVENVLDSNYRAHGSGMDAAGVNAIAGAELSF